MPVKFTPLPSADDQLAQLRGVHHHDDANLPVDKQASGPHLASGVAYDLIHGGRHAERLTDEDVVGDPQSVQFHASHVQHHLREAAGGMVRLTDWLKSNDSNAKAFAEELEQVKELNPQPPPAA